MQKVVSRLGLTRVLVGSIAVLLILGSWWGVGRMNDGLVTRRFKQDGVPLTFISPAEGRDLPGIVLAHGFGGSQQLMLGYGLGFARAGYAVMLLNFSGHASNPNPLSTSRDALQDDLDTALQALTAQPEVNPNKVALLGHSMGSGAVMQAGIEHPDRYAAVIAVSPTSAEVSDSTPPNLMLQVGAWETRFLANAQELLAEAGGATEGFAEKRARRLVVIPNAQHITILFSAKSREMAADWLSSSFGVERELNFTDTRMTWYGMHLLGWLMIALAFGPLAGMRSDAYPAQPEAGRRWLGLLLAPFVATGFLSLLAGWADLSGFLGLQVGGALAIWFFVMGMVWLVAAVRTNPPRRQNLLWGGLLFALIWVAMGLIAQFTWMQWFLITPRLWRWPILALACLPWKLALGHALQRAKGWRRAGLWAIQSVVLLVSLLMVASWIPGMFVIMLIAPVLLIVLGVEILISRHVDDPWVYAIGSALFFGWVIVGFFPIA
ncbi:MAG: alpha/beta fold hydrolase [Anaerolineales bacterium]|nr:MAG: alpha/beta fold hydrolase [Anaerolineales bacterium]